MIADGVLVLLGLGSHPPRGAEGRAPTSEPGTGEGRQAGSSPEPLLMSAIIVRPLEVMTEAVWSFRDSVPTWRHHELGSSATFDPFPAYPHDLDVVQETAKVVSELCPPLWDVDLYVADREEVGRSNGFSNVAERDRYVDGEWTQGDPVGLIMLSGKRVPPHPALTAYLVAHEYGHHVEWMLQRARGAKSLHGDEVVAEYAKYRGLPDTAVHPGTGGRWHDSATEIFACDFRILVCGIETGFWPHPGIAHPGDLSIPDLRGWWERALEELANHRAKNVAAAA